MKNIYTPKKKMFKTTATFCEVEGVGSLSFQLE